MRKELSALVGGLVLLMALTLSACELNKQGSFEIELEWPEGVTLPYDGSLCVQARMTDGSVNLGSTKAKQLVPAASLDFPPIPVGTNRIVFAEITPYQDALEECATDSDSVLLYGKSDPFEIIAAEVQRVVVQFEITKPFEEQKN